MDHFGPRLVCNLLNIGPCRLQWNRMIDVLNTEIPFGAITSKKILRPFQILGALVHALCSRQDSKL